MKNWMFKLIIFMTIGAMVIFVFWVNIEIYKMRKEISEITIEMEKAIEELTNYEEK